LTQDKLRVGVVFGSRSSEHNVSIHSAESVLENLDRSKYEVIPLAITRDGTWLPGVEPIELLKISEKQQAEATIEQSDAGTAVTKPGTHPLLAQVNGADSDQKPFDVIFPVLHGPYGEDGTIQGLLEMADIPYVGCGVLGSALGMDKEKMKMLFQLVGLPTVEYMVSKRHQWERSPDAVISEAEQRIGYPCIVKPVNMGSSIGISKATNTEELSQAITTAALYDNRVLIERFINNREISCAVLGNDEPITSLVGELVFEEKRVLDYEEKYIHPTFRFCVPAEIPESLAQDIREKSLLAFRTLDLSGLARVDFFLDRDSERLFLNEVNTLPGFTDDSIYPKMWAASGLPYPQLLDRLIALALERYQDRKNSHAL
jgi:D-alanine-D-alanine ligase